MRPTRNHGLTDAERLRMCEGKVRYADAVGAIAGGMISLEQHGQENGVSKLYYYQCPSCFGFHLTRKKHPGQEPITIQQMAAA